VELLLILAAAGLLLASYRKALPVEPAPAPAPSGDSRAPQQATPAPGAPQTPNALNDTLAGVTVGAAVGAGLGSSVTAAESAGLAAAGTALIGAGPVGAVVAGGAAIVEQQKALMSDVERFRDIKYMLSAGEAAEWNERKKRTETFPTSLDSSVHRRLHDYELSMTAKYEGEAGIAEYQTRADAANTAAREAARSPQSYSPAAPSIQEAVTAVVNRYAAGEPLTFYTYDEAYRAVYLELGEPGLNEFYRLSSLGVF